MFLESDIGNRFCFIVGCI